MIIKYEVRPLIGRKRHGLQKLRRFNRKNIF